MRNQRAAASSERHPAKATTNTVRIMETARLRGTRATFSLTGRRVQGCAVVHSRGIPQWTIDHRILSCLFTIERMAVTPGRHAGTE
jgi:hypothetical protein